MRKRLVELGQPVGGRKDDIWNRLSKAEAKLKEHNEKMELLRLRHEQAVENGPTIEPRVLPGPNEPTPEEREAHNLLHMVPADWCEACVRGTATANPHKKLTYDKRDVGKARVYMDFAYMKTDGHWVDPFHPAPPAAEIFATTLILVDADTLSMRAFSMPTKATTDYAVAAVIEFMAHLNLERAALKCDGEPSIKSIAKLVKERRTKPTDLEEGSLKDSPSMGGVESPIRWWQAKVRTYRYDLERRYGLLLTADSEIWC